MSIADTPAQRADFVAEIHRLTTTITDLSRSIDVALQVCVPAQTMILLAQSDVHLENAQNELNKAAAHINAINGGLTQ